MPATKEYQWDYIAPNATVGVYIYGYSEKCAVAYSAVVWDLDAKEVPYPLGRIDLITGPISRHLDRSIARTVWVKNRAAFNPCAVDLHALYDYV